MRSKLWICSTLLFISGIGSAAAQLCSGEPNFNRVPARLFATMGFGSSSFYHGGLAVGRAVLFAGFETGMTTYQNDESWDYRINLGAEIARGHDPRAQVCPQVLLSLTSGSGDVSGIDYREQMIGAGINAGFVLYQKGNTRIFPTASFGLLGGRIKYTYSTGTKRTQDADAYGLLTTGIGFGLNKQLTISPTVTVPLGLKGESTWYGVTFSIGKIKED